MDVCINELKERPLLSVSIREILKTISDDIDIGSMSQIIEYAPDALS